MLWSEKSLRVHFRIISGNYHPIIHNCHLAFSCGHKKSCQNLFRTRMRTNPSFPLNIAVIPPLFLWQWCTRTSYRSSIAIAVFRWGTTTTTVCKQQRFAIGEKHRRRNWSSTPCENENKNVLSYIHTISNDDRVINLLFTGGIGSFSFSSHTALQQCNTRHGQVVENTWYFAPLNTIHSPQPPRTLRHLMRKTAAIQSSHRHIQPGTITRTEHYRKWTFTLPVFWPVDLWSSLFASTSGNAVY